jgi:hypothetical protein
LNNLIFKISKKILKKKYLKSIQDKKLIFY